MMAEGKCRKGVSMSTKEIVVPIKVIGLEEAIKKADRLVELLREALQIVDSLSNKDKLES